MRASRAYESTQGNKCTNDEKLEMWRISLAVVVADLWPASMLRAEEWMSAKQTRTRTRTRASSTRVHGAGRYNDIQ